MDDERPFLHDLSTPLMTIIMMIDTLQIRMNKAPDADEHVKSQLKKTMELLNEVRLLLKKRRETLIRRGK
jgi:hypothetical protein